tara:strand:+ start:1176 stop:1460 length:285 start_codon:yes stop_codon:yes gene_type:complete
MDLEQKYKEETGFDVGKIQDVSVTYYSDDYVKWLEKAINYTCCCTEVYVVTERDNYGEQLFRGVFANREKAVEYLAEDGLKESNINEINEIELK